MTPEMLWARRRLLALGTALAGAAALAACSGSAQGGGPSGADASDGGAPGGSASGRSATGSAADGSAPSAGAHNPLAADAVADPRELTGPAQAASVPEVVALPDPSEPTLPVTVTDHQGTEVTITDTSRVLALDLYGTLAETVIALGQGDRLVGRVTSSTQESLADLPLVTVGGHDLNVEAILGLAPTLVLMDTTNGPVEVTEQLRSAGVAVVHFTPDRTMDGITTGIEKVAEALGVPEDGKRLSRRVQGELDAAIEQIAQVAPSQQERLRMAFLYVRGTAGVFFVLGDGSGADDLIAAIAGRDVAGEAGLRKIVPATAEALARIDPEVILTMADGLESTGGLEGLLGRPGVQQTTAGQNRRIVTMADGQVLSFGPNTASVLLSLARVLYTKAA